MADDEAADDCDVKESREGKKKTKKKRLVSSVIIIITGYQNINGKSAAKYDLFDKTRSGRLILQSIHRKKVS